MEFNLVCSNGVIYYSNMEFIIPFSFLVINLIDAFTDTNKEVNHRRGALLYLSACVILSWFYLKFTDVHWYWLAGFSLFTRVALFDIAYNLMNDKPFIYEGSNEGKKDKSIVDWIENKLGLSIFWLRIIYIVIYLVFLIIYFLYA